jgi:CubicO group peptidase (beta-lactamase class C family)
MPRPLRARFAMMRSHRRNLSLPRPLAAAGLLLALTACAATPPPSPEGRWEGAVGAAPAVAAFALEVHREGDGWRGTFDLEAEGIRGMAVPAIRFAGDTLVAELMPGGGAVLRAVVAGDSLTGSVTLPTGSQPVRLARAGSMLAAAIAADLEGLVRSARERPLVEVATGDALARVDRAALDSLLAAAHASNTDALVVLHDGVLVGEWHRDGASRRIEAMSATKSIVSLAVMRLLTTGALASLDVPVHEFFPEWADGGIRARITVRHLLDHTSGIDAGRTTEAIYASDDFVRHALDSEIISEPGTVFFYNNSATNLLAGVIGRVAGRPLDEFLREDLFARLDTDVQWARDRAGNPHGMAGLQLHARDLARLGQLVLDGGRWQGTQLIAERWIRESVRPATPHAHSAGLLWWLVREPAAAGAAEEPAARPIIGYRADGYLGQYLTIYPAERLVGVRMIQGSPSYDERTDGFGDFTRLLRALVPAS